MTVFLIFTLIVLKIPIALALWILWRAWGDAPDQVIGEASEGGGGSDYKPGPRTRDPHDGSGPATRAVDRQKAAHNVKRVKPHRVERPRV